jgi:transposase
MCDPGARWCARADALFDVPGMHVLEVAGGGCGRLLLTVETDQTVAGCPSCGVVAVGHGRRVHRVHDAPCFAASTVLVWRKRIWRCSEQACPIQTFSEIHPLVPPRAKLTTRAITWATDALAHDDTTVSALARHLEVDWHTLWDAVELEAPPAWPTRTGWPGCPHSGWTNTSGGHRGAARTGRSLAWST